MWVSPTGGQDVSTDRTAELSGTVKKGNAEYTLEEKQHWRSELKAYQRDRAHQGKPIKDRFCVLLFIATFGKFPPGLTDTPAQEISGEVINDIKKVETQIPQYSVL